MRMFFASSLLKLLFSNKWFNIFFMFIAQCYLRHSLCRYKPFMFILIPVRSVGYLTTDEHRYTQILSLFILFICGSFLIYAMLCVATNHLCLFRFVETRTVAMFKKIA